MLGNIPKTATFAQVPSNVSYSQVTRPPSNVSSFPQQQSSRFDRPIRSRYQVKPCHHPFFIIKPEFNSESNPLQNCPKVSPNQFSISSQVIEKRIKKFMNSF